MEGNCIISFANSRGNYVKALERLNESLRNNLNGNFIGFIGEDSIGAPAHTDNPYAFKVYAFKKAIQAGYKKILWLDSSVFAIKKVQPIFDEIEKDGFIFQKAGHKAGTWTNDFTLNYFGVTRDETMKMEMIGNAGFLGLNFDMPAPNEFFKKWEAAMNAGCFKGSWDNHRHDMSCSSIIVNQMGIISLAKHGDQWLQYAGVFDETLNNTIILKAQGL